MDKQIKSKRRVSDFGEVYTARKQVVDMVDLVSKAVSTIEATVLEPACGNGNFLAEILARKLKTALAVQNGATDRDFLMLRAVSNIYGVDIQKDNVVECRERLYKQVVSINESSGPLFRRMLRDILSRNIMCGNTLTASAEKGNPLIISEWDIRNDGVVVRKDVLFSDIIENGGESTNYIHRYYYRWLSKEDSISA